MLLLQTAALEPSLGFTFAGVRTFNRSTSEASVANTAVGAVIPATAPSTPSLQVLFAIPTSAQLNGALNGNTDPGSGQALFSIDACGGQLRVANAVFDYYVKARWYNVTVMAYVNGAYSSVGAAFASVLVYLTPVVKSPTFAAASLFVFENASAGTAVGTLAAVSREGLPLAYSIASGNSLGIFALGPNPPLVPANASAGLVSLALGVNTGAYPGTSICACGSLVLNYESSTAATFSLAVTAWNVGFPSLTAQAFVAVTALNSNDRPWFVSVPLVSASETAAVINGTLSSAPPVFDEDFSWGDSLTWSILNVTGGAGSTDGMLPVLGSGAWPFAMNPTTGQLSFTSNLVFSKTAVPVVVGGYATRAYYLVRHQITDRGGLSAIADVPVAILANITAGVVGVITSFTTSSGTQPVCESLHCRRLFFVPSPLLVTRCAALNTVGGNMVKVGGDFLPLVGVTANYTSGGASAVYSVPCNVTTPAGGVPAPGMTMLCGPTPPGAGANLLWSFFGGSTAIPVSGSVSPVASCECVSCVC